MANLGRLAIAVLGLLAYQNRDKIGDMIRSPGRGTDPNNPQGGILDRLRRASRGPLTRLALWASECQSV